MMGPYDSKLVVVFALCLFLAGAANKDSVRFDALGPAGFLFGYTVRQKAPGILELREEDGDVSRMIYTVQVLDAERGDFLFAQAETGKEKTVRLSEEIEGFDPGAAKASRSATFALPRADGPAEIRLDRSADLTYLKRSDLPITCVVRR